MTIGRAKASVRQLVGHSTSDECKFIASLPLATLRDYYAALGARTDWAGMDRDVVLAAAGDRIAHLETMRIEADRRAARA